MSDKKFRAFVRRQPSCLDGAYSEYFNGEWLNLACHVRRAHNSGMKIKPEYWCVPMTREQHDYQHQHGELACLVKYARGTAFRRTVQGAKDWFDKRVRHYVTLWEQVEKNNVKSKGNYRRQTNAKPAN